MADQEDFTPPAAAPPPPPPPPSPQSGEQEVEVDVEASLNGEGEGAAVVEAVETSGMVPPPPSAAPSAFDAQGAAAQWSTPAGAPPPQPYSGQPAASAGAPPAPPHPGQSVPQPAGHGVPPMPQAQAMSAAPNAFTMSLSALWPTQSEVWSGRLGEAMARPKQVEAQTGPSAWTWLVPFLANALLGGLLAMAMVYSTTRTAVSGVGWMLGMDSSFGAGVGPGAGKYFAIFFGYAVIWFIAFVLMTLVALLSAKIGGGKLNWSASAQIVGVASTVFWLPLIVAFVLIMVTPAFIGIPLMMFAMAGITGMMLLGTYVGITLSGPLQRSPIVPFVWFTLIASGVLFLFGFLISFNQMVG